jgi:DNA modification methylase
MNRLRILTGDCREILPTLEPGSVQCCVTSPPYWGLRDYGANGQLGLEATPEEYIVNMVAVFRAVWRVLRDDGTLWVNMGDSYAGSWGNQGRKEGRGTQRPINGPMMQVVDDGRYPSNGSNTGKCPPGLKPKDLCMMPARLAMALQADGWYLRSEIVWAKPWPRVRQQNRRLKADKRASNPMEPKNAAEIRRICELSRATVIFASGMMLINRDGASEVFPLPRVFCAPMLMTKIESIGCRGSRSRFTAEI